MRVPSQISPDFSMSSHSRAPSMDSQFYTQSQTEHLEQQLFIFDEHPSRQLENAARLPQSNVPRRVQPHNFLQPPFSSMEVDGGAPEAEVIYSASGQMATYLEYGYSHADPSANQHIIPTSSSRFDRANPYVDEHSRDQLTFPNQPMPASHNPCLCQDCQPRQILNHTLNTSPPLVSPTPQHFYTMPPFNNLAEEVSYSTAVAGYPNPAPTYSSSLSNALQLQQSSHPHEPMPIRAPYDRPTTPLTTFPTPSELYINLMGAEQELTDSMAPPDGGIGSKSDASQQQQTQTQPHTQGPDRAKRALSRRKERQQHIAEAIGFRPTDPDSISSHDKRRHYMDCLEQYVLYLHNQLRLVGQEPIPVQRMATYRGLNSRSIRTILVHMEDMARKLNLQVMEAEQLYQASQRPDPNQINEEYHQRLSSQN